MDGDHHEVGPPYAAGFSATPSNAVVNQTACIDGIESTDEQSGVQSSDKDHTSAGESTYKYIAQDIDLIASASVVQRAGLASGSLCVVLANQEEPLL